MDDNIFPNEENLAAELRALFEKNEVPVTLPPSLTEEAVAMRLKGVTMENATQKQGKKISKGIKTALGIGIAAAFALGLLGIADRVQESRFVKEGESASAVQSTEPTQEMKTEKEKEPDDYSGILSLVKKYAEEQNEIMRESNTGGSTGLMGRVKGLLYGTKKADAGFGFSYTADEAVMEEEEADLAVYNVAVAPASAAAMTTAGSPAEEIAYGKTNVQVEGVDEADIIKNDGKYLYLLRSGTLYICLAYPGDGMKIAAKINVEEEAGDDIKWGYPNEMFLYNGKLAVVFSGTATEDGSDETGYRYSRTKVLFFDVTDPENPTLTETFGQDGWYQSSRITDGRLLLVTSYGGFVYWTYNEADDCGEYKVDEEHTIPRTYENGGDGVCVSSACVSTFNAEQPDSFTVVSAKSMDDPDAPVSSASVLGGDCQIYCSRDALYVAQYLYNWNDAYVKYGFTENTFTSSTRVTAFDLIDGEIVKGASGCIPGTPNGQFSMDEYNGFFRIATQDWNRENGNAVYVLDQDLNTVGSVTGIAPDESIQAVRFIGDTAYVVTFLQTDPLFVINLSDPTAPFIAGEVKLPGFSSYLHPVGENLLLGVGTGGDEEGTDGSAKLSLFDVSDPVEPKEVSSVVISDAYFNAGSRSFCDCGENGWMIPYTRYATVQHSSDSNSYIDMRYFGGAVRVRIEDGKLTIAGRYESADFEADRTTYIADTVYAFSSWNETRMLLAFDMQSGDCIGEIKADPVEYTVEDTVMTAAPIYE